jgi:hypothetical protein
MNDVHDLNAVGQHAVDDDIVGVRNQFTRPSDSPRTIEIGVFGKRKYRAFYPVTHALGGRRIELRDVIDKRIEIVERLSPSSQWQRQFESRVRRAASIVVLARAIASSWGTLGRPSAKLASTFVRSHRS